MYIQIGNKYVSGVEYMYMSKRGFGRFIPTMTETLRFWVIQEEEKFLSCRKQVWPLKMKVRTIGYNGYFENIDNKPVGPPETLLSSLSFRCLPIYPPHYLPSPSYNIIYPTVHPFSFFNSNKVWGSFSLLFFSSTQTCSKILYHIFMYVPSHFTGKFNRFIF